MGFENSGRRQSAAVKAFRGNPGKRPLKNEPKPPPGVVTCPETLSKGAKGVWQELSGICIEMGTLTIADVPAFGRLCELEVTAREASRQKDAPDFAMFTLSQDFDGAAKVGVHAAIKVERETASALRQYYDYFGMTPNGRARLSVPKTSEAPAQKWGGMLT